MNKQKRIITYFMLLTSIMIMNSMTVLAVTEEQIKEYGKDKATGSIFIWFLCAIAFLKVSRKIDSFMSSLGINVGNTGGSMLMEAMVATRGITTAKNVAGGNIFKNGSGSSHANQSSFLSGGLSGVVGRQFSKGAINGVTGQGGNPISNKMFQSSAQKGGSFANNITSKIATGDLNHTASMKGEQASQALTSYMGQVGMPDAPCYSNVEIRGGQITGTETSATHPNGTDFSMHHADQYMAPEGKHETVTTSDNSNWYKQYATEHIERNPYKTNEGDTAYDEKLVQKMPDMPKRKGKDTV